jgi:hypothetical protein
MTDECRVYLCPRDESIYCVVSPIDYEWCQQWRWQFTWDKAKRKRYATRSTRLAGNRRVKFYLHKQILERAGKVQPSEKHTIGDHQDGDSLNNQRDNLEYATPIMNALNRRKPANDNHTEQKKAA